MNQQALDLIVKARANMIIDQPFFGTLALRLRLQEAPHIKTLAVDGRTMFYNPDYVISLGLDYTKSAVAHEVMHCVLDHISRISGRDRTKWNRAADFALNPIIKDAGFRLKPEWLLNPAYAGMTADHIYTLLPDGEKGEDGDPDGSGNGLCDVLPATGDGQEEDSEGKSPDDGGNYDGLPPSVDWKVATAQAAQAAKMQGKLPASLQRFVDEIIGNKVDWKAQLRRFITEVSKSDYSWMRPNRRFLSAGLYLPGLYSEDMGEVVIVVDTSGSVDGPTLQAFAAEISALRDMTRPIRTHVVYADAAVQRVDVFEQDDVFKIDAKGGGGTDFRPAFDYLEERGVQPACLLYLTDMYGSFPDTPASFPVMWCATTDVTGPWGETIKIDI